MAFSDSRREHWDTAKALYGDIWVAKLGDCPGEPRIGHLFLLRKIPLVDWAG